MSARFEPPRRGVGLVYTPRLHELFLSRPNDIAVAEIEPQTGWSTTDSITGPFAQIELMAALWAALPQHKNLHSVAMPLAGLRSPNPSQMIILHDLVERFGTPYVSEHLSIGGTPHQNAGFLLPPRQTAAGVANAARNIRELAGGVGVPVAVETGVSYLPPYPGEIPDGDYVRLVAESADCGILLDVHNIYCNERNGRQGLMDFAAALPAERVWELHIAGGIEKNGYWLDAHSGEPPHDLVEMTRHIVRGLPCLSAIIFEIYPSYLGEGSESVVLRSLETAHALWEEAGKAIGDGMPSLLPIADAGDDFGPEDLSRWETELTRSIRFALPAELGADLSTAPAISLYHNLAHSFRSSSIARLMPRTLRLLSLCGEDFEDVLWTYEKDVPPPLFAINEAVSFRDWMLGRPLVHPAMSHLVDFELALVQVPITGKPSTVHFPGDPQPLFQAISESSRPPETFVGAPWEIEITPDHVETTPGHSGLAS
jgi:uncharacterized protein